MKIGICGKMCSGKSTISDYIMRTQPGYQKYSFAQKVKELCIELFNMKTKDRPLLINFANKMRDIDRMYGSTKFYNKQRKRKLYNR